LVFAAIPLLVQIWLRETELDTTHVERPNPEPVSSAKDVTDNPRQRLPSPNGADQLKPRLLRRRLYPYPAIAANGRVVDADGAIKSILLHVDVREFPTEDVNLRKVSLRSLENVHIIITRPLLVNPAPIPKV
jgi:hypothetical protein